MEVHNISKVNKTVLTKVIKNCLKNKDFETAKNYINTFGPKIKGFDINVEIKKIEELQSKENGEEDE